MSPLNPFELNIIILGETLVLLTLCGLVARGHVKTCWSFAAYLAVVFVTDAAMLFLMFDTLAFWLLREIVLDGLKFAIAIELVSRAFARFPGARATAQRTMRLVLLLTLVVLIWVAAGWDTAPAGSSREIAARIAGEFQPRVATALAWLFTAIAGLILWYRLPVESISKAVLVGLVPYLILSYVMLELRNVNQWPTGGWLATLDTWAWQLLMVYWARTAWQPFREIMPGRSQMPAVQRSAG